MKYRVEETAQHHSVYEIEANSEEEALAKLREDGGYVAALTDEFWGEVFREITVIDGRVSVPVEIHGPKGTATVVLPTGNRVRLRFGAGEVEAVRRVDGRIWKVEVVYGENDTVAAFAEDLTPLRP